MTTQREHERASRDLHELVKSGWVFTFRNNQYGAIHDIHGECEPTKSFVEIVRRAKERDIQAA